MENIFSHSDSIGAAASGAREGLFVFQILLLLIVGRLLGEVMARFRQPPVVGYLLAGMALGPTLFGAIWPEAQKAIFSSDKSQKDMIDAISDVGVLMLLLLTGMETDLKVMRNSKSKSLVIALCGLSIPFALGTLLGYFLPDSLLGDVKNRLVASLFLGTALSVSSVKVVATVVRELKFLRRDLGQIIVASAIAEDTIGWVVIALLLGIAGNHQLNLTSATLTLGEVILFLVASFTIGRRVVFWLIQWANDHFNGEFPIITMVLAIMCTMALITQAIGVRTVLGAFVSGILVGQSPIFTRHIRDQISGLTAAFFMPIFFGTAGLDANLRVLTTPSLIGWTFIVIAIASIGKFSGAFIGSKICRFSFRQSLALGSAMNARGSTEVIVVSIGLSAGILTQNLFTMAVTMAIVTTLIMPPLLRAALSGVPLETHERERLEQEEIDRRGFVYNLERLLLAVDGSAIGQFAARICGMIAGVKGMPVTIVHFEDPLGKTKENATPDHSRQAVSEGAKSSASSDESSSSKEGSPSVKTQVKKKDDPKIDQEKGKGYDLLVIGVAPSHTQDGRFSKSVIKQASDFAGPVAIVTSPKNTSSLHLREGARILVPINGTEFSRRAVEIAFAIARPIWADIGVFYAGSAYRRSTQNSITAIMQDITQLGERYGVTPRAIIEPKSQVGTAILTEAEKNYDLIVLGVNRHAGDEFFIGDTAISILSKWKGPILFVIS